MNGALKQFVEKVMHISPGYTGMGGASAGIVGASATSDQIVQDLRSKVLVFAREHAKPAPDQQLLAELSDQVEGALLSVKLINGISDATLDQLIDELHALTGN